MKVMQINGVFHRGSTGAIIDSIDQLLEKNGIDTVVCYGIGPREKNAIKFCYRYEQAIYRRVSKVIGLRYGFAPFSTRRLIKTIKKEAPDIVHLHSVNGNCLNIYSLLKWLKKNSISTVITNHAEFFYTGNCTSTYGCTRFQEGCLKCPHKKWATDGAIYCNTNRSWKKMKEAFDGFKKISIVSVSEYITRQSLKSPIVNQFRHETIFNGIDTNIFYPRNARSIKERHGIKINEKVLLFVTAEFSTDKNHLKGGYYFIKLAELMGHFPYKFVLVGSVKNIDESKYPNILFVGSVYEKNLLAEYYSMADVTLSLSKAESFGLTCAESLCCGTPVAGFKSGGANSISIQQYSFFTEVGNVKELADHLEEFIDLCANKKGIISSKARERYSDTKMGEQYMRLYKTML